MIMMCNVHHVGVVGAGYLRMFGIRATVALHLLLFVI